MACNTCSGHGLNGRINASFARVVTLKGVEVKFMWICYTRIHGQVLESVAGSKYLGVEISSNLSFNGHIQNITTSASRSLGFLKRNIRSRNPELREMAYKTLVRPLVEYSSSVWSPYTKSNIARLEMVQRRAARWTLSEYSP